MQYKRNRKSRNSKMPKEANRESIIGFVNSFKLFEQKLDKVQEDVLYQGRILSDLKVMVKKLSDQVQQSQHPQDATPKRKTKSFGQSKKLPKKPVAKGSNRTNVESITGLPKFSHRVPILNAQKITARSPTETKKKLDKGDHTT